MHCVTFSEEADLKSMPAGEEQKQKQHLGTALRMGLSPVAPILQNLLEEHSHRKAPMRESHAQTKP